jgi:hypothetical protein
LAHTYDQEKWWNIEEDYFVAENPSSSPLLKPYTLLDASAQDQHSLETPRNQIPLSYNCGGEERVSEELAPHSLLTASDKDAMNRGDKDISEHETDLLPAFEKQISASVPGSPRFHSQFPELSQHHSDPGYNQSEISQGGSEELGHGSPPQHQHHDEDQPEDRQHEKVAEEEMRKDNKDDHAQDGWKQKRKYQEETSETYPSEDEDLHTNDKDNNNPQPSKRRKAPQLLADNVSALSRKHNPKRRLRQCHCLALPSTTRRKTHEEQSQNNCNHLHSAIDNDHSYTSQTFESSYDRRKAASMAEYQEWPFQGLLKCAMIGNGATYNISLQLDHVPERLHVPILSKFLGFGADNVVLDSPSTVNITGEDEWVVDAIRAVRKRYNKLEYRADWLGVDEDSKYYPASDFKYSPHKIRDFHLAHPNLPGPPENLLKWIKKWEEGVDNYDELNGSKEMSQYSRTRFFRKGGVI